MVKSILIPLDPSAYTDTAIKIGCTIAKTHGAQLTGLVVLDIDGIEKHIGPVPAGGSYYAEKLEEKHLKDAQERIDKLVENFKRICTNAGVKHIIAQNQGSPSDRILHESIFYDMIITGLRTFFHFETSDKPGESISKLLHESITPIYGVPEKFNPPDLSNEKLKVLIPFDASPSSSRALQRFAQFMIPETSEPLIVMSHDDKEIALAALEHAKRYLELHGFGNVRIEWTDDHIIEACDKKYLDWAHVAVVGSHSKRGLFDFMVGSLTNHLIKLNKIPVVIGQ